MASEKSRGAGLHLSGVLERSTPPRPAPPVEPNEPDQPAEAPEPEPESPAGRGRGAASRRAPAASKPAARKIKGRTVYLPDDLFERILVQAHRRDKTISEYVTAILERQVPDYRTIRAEPGDDAAA